MKQIKKTTSAFFLLAATMGMHSANATSADDVRAGNEEAGHRAVAVKCLDKTSARDFIASSKSFVRKSFVNHAAVERLASARPANFDDIATLSNADCQDLRPQLQKLKQVRAEVDAQTEQMMTKFIKPAK